MRIAALLVVLASGCAAAAPERPSRHDAPSRHDVWLLAYQKIGIVRVEDIAAPAASAPAAEPEVAATVRGEGREVDLDVVNQTATDQTVLATDGTPKVSFQVYIPDQAQWGEVWRVEGARCGNALHLIDVAPGRALRITIRTGSNAGRVRARFQLAGRTADAFNRLVLRTSSEIEVPVDAALLESLGPISPEDVMPRDAY